MKTYTRNGQAQTRRPDGRFGHPQSYIGATPSQDFNWDEPIASFRKMMDELYREGEDEAEAG